MNALPDALNPQTDATPGWYGKVAALGDFAQRRVPPHWVRHCDAWLSGLMNELPAALGPRWLDTYLTAPVLRFAWAPGVVDMRWWFGVLMPSCDNVGRYFPLVIAQSRAQPPVDRAGLDHLDRWYTVLANAAMRTLDDAATVDTLEQTLAAAPPWPASHAATLPAPEDAGGWTRYTAPASLLTAAVPMLAAGELMERLAGCTVWSPNPEPSAQVNLRWGPGLPAVDGFAAMLKAEQTRPAPG
ncbi:type VI secretion-associated protein [Roseateles aquatilis]|uniref:Type VI secretion-associated protein n=1 Tax=Roseateles aquatilis TaxID=431061 RepID=A0A246IW41_9BURK|nr:type VI secretion system-associated protein TagF [Roseateles aquatilis]OWQ84441.1 type VI secretion-associated protein [Roseateles aquatilis]